MMLRSNIAQLRAASLLLAVVLGQAALVLSAVLPPPPESCEGFTCGPSTHCELTTTDCPTALPAPSTSYDADSSSVDVHALRGGCPACVSDVTNSSCSDVTCAPGSACQLVDHVTPTCVKLAPPSCSDVTCAVGRGCVLKTDHCSGDPPTPVCVSRRRPCSKTACPEGYTCRHIPGECQDHGDHVTDLCPPTPRCVLQEDPCATHRCTASEMCEATRVRGFPATARCITPPCHYARPPRGFTCENREAACCEPPCGIVATFVARVL